MPNLAADRSSTTRSGTWVLAEGAGVPIVAGVGVFLLAALSTSDVPGMGDSAELTLALALAGVAHPTGYPIYVLAGHGFVSVLHALGLSWVLAASLWSAAGAAVAAGAFARCVQHVVALVDEADRRAGRPASSAVTSWVALSFPIAALALDPVWLDVATKAEVYTWSDATLFLAAALMLGRLRAWESDREVAVAAADWRTALGWGLLCGACGALHVTTLLVVLPMSAALVAASVKSRRWTASHVVWAFVGAVVPLASYGWIAWRAAHPAPFQWPVEPTFSSWWMHVRGAVYTRYLGHFSPDREEWLLIRGALLPFILPGLVIGSLVALRATSNALRWGLLALLGGTALQIAFIVSYSVPDPSPYFLPALMASLLVAPPAIQSLARRISAAAVAALAVAILLALGAWSWTRGRDTRGGLARVDAGFRDAWRKIPFDRGIVLWADDHYHRFLVLQLLEGRRPDLYVEDPEMLVWPVRRHAFEARFGFDPLDGLTLRTTRDLEKIPEAIRRRARVPVLILPQ